MGQLGWYRENLRPYVVAWVFLFLFPGFGLGGIKLKKLLMSLVLCALLLVGCAAKALPKGMEEDTVIRAGQEIVNLLVDEEYEEVAGRFRADVAETVTPEIVQNLMEDATLGLGIYEGRTDAMATGRTVDGVEYGEAVILCEYKKGDVLFRIAFDTDMALVGMEISEQ